jgi:hypothetical protein
MREDEASRHRFSVGSLVRVKRGVTAPNGPESLLGGWCGRVYQTSGPLCLVHWSGATLETVRPASRERWEQEDEDCRTMWLHEKMLEADPGEPLCIERAGDTDPEPSGSLSTNCVFR